MLLLALLLAVLPAPEPASPLQVLSFNLRYNTPEDGPNAWPYRADRAAALIRFHGADVVGVQEALIGMLRDLEARMPGFAWVGDGRDDGAEGGELSAILYRTERLALLDHGTFWLSPTPEVVGSRGWDAALPRVATWARFRDRASGRVFVHLNTHFDHAGAEARAESARLLLRRAAALAGDAPLIVTGDFNAMPEALPYRLLTSGDGDPALAWQDAYVVSETPHYGPASTWNGFDAIEPGRRIDYVFVRGPVRVERHGILTDRWDGRFPSDHLPVLATVVWTE